MSVSLLLESAKEMEVELVLISITNIFIGE